MQHKLLNFLFLLSIIFTVPQLNYSMDQTDQRKKTECAWQHWKKDLAAVIGLSAFAFLISSCDAKKIGNTSLYANFLPLFVGFLALYAGLRPALKAYDDYEEEREKYS